MSEKVICVVETKRVKKGDNEWIELIDIEGKTHRVFGSIQAQDGTWKHFEDKFNALEKSEGKFIKLIKEKKGNFWNVIGLELDVKEQVEEKPQGQVDTSAMEKSAEEGKPYEGPPTISPRKAPEGKNKAFALSYAKDLAMAGVIDRMQILTWAEFFDGWLNGNIYIPDKVVTELFSKYVVAATKEV